MSHFEVLGIRTSAFGFWENTIQPIQVPTSASWLIFSEVLFFSDVTPPSTDVSENNHSCFLRSTAQSVTTSSIASSIPTPYKQIHFSPISKTNCNNKSFPWNSCPTLALFLYSFFIAYISSLYLLSSVQSTHYSLASSLTISLKLLLLRIVDDFIFARCNGLNRLRLTWLFIMA